ncbi:hypothetical protein ACFWIB_10450 [Streptomyces sp. NPDC127051]|uniref:hypothetical protein n=1 Tax=Streptomyces sp. NPDC127051 TaxID=3347119 RepID=UPI0036526DAF
MTAAGSAHLVDALGSALRSGDHGLKAVPGLLKRVLQEGAWRSFVTQRGERVEYDRFEDFVVRPPLKGLGASVELVRTLIRNDAEALDLFDVAVQGGHGGNRHSDSFKLHNIQLEEEKATAPSGTSREAGLRRLRKDRPDLHADVLAGTLTTHAAMVKAGFRRRMVTIPADTPENVAKALRRNLPPEAIAQLAQLLTAES